MKIALLKPPSTYADWYRQPVIGISYLCASLREQGYECKIFDAYFNHWSREELIEKVLSYGPDVIGFSAMTHEIRAASDIAHRIKKALPGTMMIVGGCHVTALPEETLEEFPVFDFGIYGEGEHTLNELVANITKPAAGKTIQGLVYREDGNVVKNPPRASLTSEELDALPFPAYDEYYPRGPEALSGKNSKYVIFSSRGCPYNCSFCMQVLGRKVRRRTTRNVLREMEHAIKTYGAHTFDFSDEIFLFNDNRTKEMLNEFISSGMSRRIKWTGLTRANLVSEEIIALARESGCIRMDMGVESGDDEILARTNKRITVAQIKDAVRIIKKYNISMGTYYILGHPGETVATIKKTCDLAAQLNTQTIAVGIMVPYPGTVIYDMALKGEHGYKLISKNWEDYDKYGGHALEIQGLSYDVLEKWQKKILLSFYLRNFRFMDLASYVWQRKSALIYFLKKRLLPA